MKLCDFKLAAKDFGKFGRGLHSPECVWVDRDGVWASDARGGVCRVRDDADPELLGTGIVNPNGFSRRPDGTFVVAGIGDGRLYAILPGGQTHMLLDNLNGKPLGAVNYACADGPDRIWLSVMTRAPEWHAALKTDKRDGYILRIDRGGARAEIVADGLDLTNEVKLSPDRRHLYAAETLGCRIVRFPIQSDGSLGSKEFVGPANLGRGAWPDGITFDRRGNLWITMICQNGISVIDTRGDVHVVYSDADAQAVEALAAAAEQQTGTVEQLAACASANGPLKLPTSLAFGGRDGRTVFIGNVASEHIPTFRLPDSLD